MATTDEAKAPTKAKRKRSSHPEVSKRPQGRAMLDAYGFANAKGAARGLLDALMPEVLPREKSFSIETVNDAIEYVAGGGTLAEFCRGAQLPYTTVYRWIDKAGQRDAFTQAMRDGADAMADQLWRIASTPTTGVSETIVTKDAEGNVVSVVEKHTDQVNARKLLVSAGLELLRHRNPDKYGAHTTTEVNVTMSGAITAARNRVRCAGDIVDATVRETVTAALPDK